MEHNQVSMDEIVGRVIRNTRIPDLSYIQDIIPWIYEAMRAMQTKWSLSKMWEDKDVYFHRVAMPCGCIVLEAVEHAGYRLKMRNTDRHPGMSYYYGYDSGPGIWISEVQKVVSPNGFTAYEQKQTTVPQAISVTHWYEEDGPGHITTSLREGSVRFHFRGYPVDKHNLPLIPDQEDFKEALYWYCRTKMIETGWTDPVLNWQLCDTKWNMFADKGRAAIKYPSTNRMEQISDMDLLIPPQNYFDSFSNLQDPGFPTAGVRTGTASPAPDHNTIYGGNP